MSNSLFPLGFLPQVSMDIQCRRLYDENSGDGMWLQELTAV